MNTSQNWKRLRSVVALRPLIKALHAGLAILVSVNVSSAELVDVVGTISPLPAAPLSTEVDHLESDEHVFVFAEQQNVVLGDDLRVSLAAPGVYQDRTDLPFPVPTIPAGTAVSSYFFHADPATRGIHYSGTAHFDARVLGVILGGVLLEESDFLGAPGTVYPADSFFSGRGLALSGQDIVLLSSLFAGKQTVSFGFRTGQLIDQMRVITAAPAAVPEPAVALLLGSAVAAFLLARRRREPADNTGTS